VSPGGRVAKAAKFAAGEAGGAFPLKRSRGSVSVIVLTGLILASTGVLGIGRSGSSARGNALDNTVLVQINGVRQAHALSQLKLSKPLSVAAAQHTAEMGQSGYFAHDSLDHTLFWKRIERSYLSTGFRSWDVGENLLFVSPDVSAAKAIRLWMNSPEHRANLLDPAWREIGIGTRHFNAAPGFYSDGPVTILTTDFGTRS
jgi:uncharacterized protein YkwD